jgi:hypothetical protein
MQTQPKTTHDLAREMLELIGDAHTQLGLSTPTAESQDAAELIQVSEGLMHRLRGAE